MKIQPTPRFVYSMDDPPATEYWWFVAALLVAAVRGRQRSSVLMIGSCGWTVKQCAEKLGVVECDWYGLEPDERYRSGPAFGTPAEIFLVTAGRPFDVVIVDAYVLNIPVAEWQSMKNIKAIFAVRSGAVVIFHGDIGVKKDKYRVEIA